MDVLATDALQARHRPGRTPTRTTQQQPLTHRPHAATPTQPNPREAAHGLCTDRNRAPKT